MDYYAFEYSVLMCLNNMLKIESINIGKETYEVITKVRNRIGKLEDKKIATYDINSNIMLNFYHNFHYCFNREILWDEYNYVRRSSPKDVAEKIRDNVVREFTKLIVK